MKQYNLESNKYKIYDFKKIYNQCSKLATPFILNQHDIYLKTSDSKQRVKIRIEDNDIYAVQYYRSNIVSQKESKYDFYKFKDKNDYGNFMEVFGNCLNKINEVKKERHVFIYQNAHIHLDKVENLGNFIEIEILIKNKTEQENSETLLSYLIDLLDLDILEKEGLGYNELTQLCGKRDYDYYLNCDKMYWVMNKDLLDIKANTHVPCIFINDKNEILQIDPSIKNDGYRYTLFRKVAGQDINQHVKVSLMHNNTLYDLKGNEVKFTSLGRCNDIIDKYLLSPISKKK